MCVLENNDLDRVIHGFQIITTDRFIFADTADRYVCAGAGFIYIIRITSGNFKKFISMSETGSDFIHDRDTRTSVFRPLEFHFEIPFFHISTSMAVHPTKTEIFEFTDNQVGERNELFY